MNQTPAAPIAELNDEKLVALTRAGDRDAFRAIVERYQTLVCSVAYSGTGDLAQSEDVAQEAFIAGWKQMAQLREPSKLRSWLCGIAQNLGRNRRRRLATEPSHGAESLPAETSSGEPPPSEQAVSREREAILWQALERMPEEYRQPLVLFYREHQSVARVAYDLDLSEEAVRQRLSRGRRLLQQEVLGIIEGTLAQTAPGAGFTSGVMGALPLLAMPMMVGVASTGGTAAKWGSLGLGAKLLTLINVAIGPALGLVAAWLGVRAAVEGARTERERAYVKRYLLKLGAAVVAFTALSALLSGAAKARVAERSTLLTVWATVGVLYTGWIVLTAFRAKAALARLRADALRQDPLAFTPEDRVSWNYRSRATLLGVPLVHMRFDMRPEDRGRPVIGWIAVGDYAVGILFAVGGVAIGGISIGGISAGLLTIGGACVGGVACGGLALGLYVCGGLAIGLVAAGGVAIAWHAAMGGYAVAHDFVVAGTGSAHHVNDSVAQAYFAEHPWLDLRTVQGKILLAVIWAPALFVIWQYLEERRRKRAAG